MCEARVKDLKDQSAVKSSQVKIKPAVPRFSKGSFSYTDSHTVDLCHF